MKIISHRLMKQCRLTQNRHLQDTTYKNVIIYSIFNAVKNKKTGLIDHAVQFGSYLVKFD